MVSERYAHCDGYLSSDQHPVHLLYQASGTDAYCQHFLAVKLTLSLIAYFDRYMRLVARLGAGLQVWETEKCVGCSIVLAS